MKNWEERFDKKFEGELWLGKYIDVDENGNQYVHRLELKDFIRRLLEEQNLHIRTLIDATQKCVNDKCPCSKTLDKIYRAGLSQPATRHGEEGGAE